MKRIRYLSLLMLLLCGISTWGQNGFNPSDPPEPGVPPMKLEVEVYPAEAGSASGAGRYVPGTTVYLSAYANTGFRFVKWTNAAGETVSTSSSFNYTKGEGNEKLTANYVFDPNGPAEPVDPTTIMYYQLTLNATEGGTVSGGGRYLAGQQITLRANRNSQYDFVGWYDEEGNLVSNNSSFTYTTTAKHRTLTARFAFNPDSPLEPSEPTLKPKHNIYVVANEGGTVNLSYTRLQEGESVELYAYCNTGYVFDGWYLNGELYTRLTHFSYTVSNLATQNFEARFTFDPADPNEPNMPTTTNHAFFLMNKVTVPGSMVKFPIYLSNVRTIGDMTFQLTFPEELKPDLTSVEMSDKAEGYTVSCSAVDDTTYVFSLIGGQVEAGNAALLVFTVPIPERTSTGKNYQVKINQVSLTEEDGTTITASTRNGRISVYKLGDTNGDDNVNVFDCVNMINKILNKKVDVFIFEVSDIEKDETINVLDIVQLISIILNN